MRSASLYMENFTGVAVDDADNIYIADNGIIIKLNKDLEILNQIRHTSLQGVSVVGDEVMVCDRDNSCITLKNWSM